MAKQKVLGSAAGWLADFYGQLENALHERGVSPEEIYTLVTKKPRPQLAIGKIADAVAELIHEEQDPLARAVNILGSGKVLTAEQAAKAQQMPVPQNVTIRYTKETLRECAKANAENGTDWRLVYLFGFSLRNERQKFGINTKSQPCFHKDSTWWLEKSEDAWATEKPDSGYYLIDFMGRFSRTSWINQEAAIEKLGNEFERANERAVAEAIISIFQTTGERLLEDWWHWGRSLDSDGGRVDVSFPPAGLSVSDNRPDWGDNDWLRVCVARKFQS